MTSQKAYALQRYADRKKETVNQNEPSTKTHSTKINNSELQTLCKKNGFNPIDIGCEILESCGYKVTRYNLSGAIYVEDSSGKYLWSDPGGYVD